MVNTGGRPVAARGGARTTSKRDERRRHATASGHRVEPRRRMKRYKRRLTGAQELREAQIEGMGRRDGGSKRERAAGVSQHRMDVLYRNPTWLT